MKLPRDVSGQDLVRCLGQLGYNVIRQTGSHIRLTCNAPQEHHITIPNHDPLKVGTLSAILADIAFHRKLSRDELIQRLFGR